MSSSVDKIKEKLSIVDVVEQYIKLDNAGGSLKGKCPFHNEKTPSFFVSPERGTYYCFGCGAKGDMFTFVQEFESIDFVSALKMLAEKAGVTLEQENTQVKGEKERLYKALELATLFYHTRLLQHTEAKAYLKERGLKEYTVREWQLGFSGEDWRELYDHLKTKGVTDADMETAGLIKKGDRSYYDRFRSRIMFPIYDVSGRVIGFSGRIFKVEDAAKYLNSPETPLFNKSALLYGLHRAKNDIRLKDFSVLVEGQMDLVMSHQVGVTNAVATSGTALTELHLNTLKRLSSKIVIAYDADSAGLRASEKAWGMALALGMEVRVAEIPTEMDPADMALKDPEGWKKTVTESKHIIDFNLGIVIKEADPRIRALKVVENILPYVAMLGSSVEQAHFITKIASQTRVREDALWQDVRKIANTMPSSSEVYKKPSVEPAKRYSLEKKIVGVMWWQETSQKPQISPEHIRTSLVTIMGEESTKYLLEESEKERQELVFEAEIYHNNSQHFIQDVESLLIQLHIDKLKQKFEEYMRILAIAEQEQNTARAKEILKVCQEVSLQMSELKKKITN